MTRLGTVLVVALAGACVGPSGSLRLSDSDEQAVQVVRGIAPPLGDLVTVRSASVAGDRLDLVVTYGGGCKTHRFAVANDGLSTLSLPPLLTLFLAHDADGDLCERLVTRTLGVDLRPLRSVASPGGVALLLIVGPDGTPANLGELRYDF